MFGNKLKAAPFLVLILGLYSGCISDQLAGTVDCDTIVTYEDQIKEIIDRNCAYSGCHDGDGGGNPPGNYTNYEGLKPHLSDTEFRRYVIDLKDNELLGMPPSYAPAGNPQDLTDEELGLVLCWINDGYVEK